MNRGLILYAIGRKWGDKKEKKMPLRLSLFMCFAQCHLPPAIRKLELGGEHAEKLGVHAH